MKEIIEVGEYIRTPNGRIGKIFKKEIDLLGSYESTVTIYIFENGYYTTKNGIKKHSKDIIDLLESKDIIEVKDLKEDKIQKFEFGECADPEKLKRNIENNNVKILRIMTYEQFKKSSYKVVK